jgi:hypothetical protein
VAAGHAGGNSLAVVGCLTAIPHTQLLGHVPQRCILLGLISHSVSLLVLFASTQVYTMDRESQVEISDMFPGFSSFNLRNHFLGHAILCSEKRARSI